MVHNYILTGQFMSRQIPWQLSRAYGDATEVIPVYHAPVTIRFNMNRVACIWSPWSFIFLTENWCMEIKILLRFAINCPMDNVPALFDAGQPPIEQMIPCILTYIRLITTWNRIWKHLIQCESVNHLSMVLLLNQYCDKEQVMCRSTIQCHRPYCPCLRCNLLARKLCGLIFPWRAVMG